MLEEDIISLCEIYDKADLNLLEISSVSFTDETTESLALFLSKLATLRHFKVKNSKIMKNHLHSIMKALVPELYLNSLTFETTLIQKKGIKLVCQLLERSNFKSLSLVEAGIDNAQVSILAGGIA